MVLSIFTFLFFKFIRMILFSTLNYFRNVLLTFHESLGFFIGIWYYEEPLTSMEYFHCTKCLMEKCSFNNCSQGFLENHNWFFYVIAAITTCWTGIISYHSLKFLTSTKTAPAVLWPT